MSTKLFGVLAMSLVCLMLFAGAASAVVLPNQTQETNGISSSTVITCDGIVIDTINYGLEHSNQMLNGAPLESGEVYGVATYSSNLVAMNGESFLVRDASFNDQDQVTDGKNLDVVTDLSFDASTGGLAAGSESVAQFNAGREGQVLPELQLCPFGEATSQKISPFNTMVVMGSQFNVQNIDLTSTVGATTTAGSVDVPGKTDYVVSATGAGDLTTYMNVFAQDARDTGSELISPETSEYTVLFPETTTDVTVWGHFENVGSDRCPKFKWVPTTTTTTTSPEIGTTTVTPAVYSPITPSANTQYQESTTVSGTFAFYKALSFTSGIY